MHQHKGDREEVVTCSIEDVRSHAHEPPFTRLLDFSTGRVLSLLAITAYWLLNAVTIWLFWGRSTRIESDRGVSDGWLMFFIELLMSQVSSFVGAWLLSILAKFLLLFFNGQRELKLLEKVPSDPGVFLQPSLYQMFQLCTTDWRAVMRFLRVCVPTRQAPKTRPETLWLILLAWQ